MLQQSNIVSALSARYHSSSIFGASKAISDLLWCFRFSMNNMLDALLDRIRFAKDGRFVRSCLTKVNACTDAKTGNGRNKLDTDCHELR